MRNPHARLPLHPLAEALILCASSQVGVKENEHAKIYEYQRATNLQPGEWAWCAAFAAWNLREVLYSMAGKFWLQQNKITADTFRCKSARAFDWISWAQRKNLTVYDERLPALAGDLVVYDFSHIGILEKDQEQGSRFISTIEGNTNDRGSRDGDGVYRKTRKVDLVKAYIHIFEARLDVTDPIGAPSSIPTSGKQSGFIA